MTSLARRCPECLPGSPSSGAPAGDSRGGVSSSRRCGSRARASACRRLTRRAWIRAFSGVTPPVDGWQPERAGREGVRAFIAHGRNDPVMEVGFARRARDLLTAGGLSVEYHESDAAHHIDPAHVPAAVAWLGAMEPPAT